MAFRGFLPSRAAIPATIVLLLLVSLLPGSAGQAQASCADQIQQFLSCYTQSTGTGTEDFPLACCSSTMLSDTIINTCGGLYNVLQIVQDPFSLGVLSQAMSVPECGGADATWAQAEPWVACVVQSAFETTTVSFSVVGQAAGFATVFLDQQPPINVDMSTGNWGNLFDTISQSATVVLRSFEETYVPDLDVVMQTVNITLLGAHSVGFAASDMDTVFRSPVTLPPSGNTGQCCSLYSRLPNGCMGWQLDSPAFPNFLLTNQTSPAAWAVVLPALALSAASCPAAAPVDCQAGLVALQNCASASSDCCSVAALVGELCKNQDVAFSSLLSFFPVAASALAACNSSANDTASDVACEETLPGVQVMTAPDGTLIPVTKQCTTTDPSYPNCTVAYQNSQATYYFYYPLSTAAAQGTFVSAGDSCLDSSPSPTPSASVASATPSPSVTTQVHGNVPTSQKQALLDLYYATAPSWWSSTPGTVNPWDPTKTPCQWPGVNCVQSSQGVSEINSLYLPSAGLSGTLPASIGLLTSLQWLFLSGNALSGTIPDVFSSMPKLQQLDLSQNQFTGTVPASIGALQQVAFLRLNNNNLNGSLPDVFTSMRSLTFADFSSNSLAGSIPTSLGNPPLSSLYLGNNLFTGSFPCSFANFFMPYVYVDVNNNPYLTDIELPTDGCPVPSEQTQALTDFYMSSGASVVVNWDTGLSPCNGPNRWWGVKCVGVTVNSTYSYFQIGALLLPSTGLGGSIPSSISALVDLTSLDLSYNQLVGTLPSSIGHLVSLQRLNLTSNSLTGSLPSTLGNLANLSVLKLGYNSFSGTLPSLLGKLSHLTYLALNNNGLTGSLPASLGNLTSLAYLSVAFNPLAGTLPSSLGNLAQLQTLSVSDTAISGTIPASLANLAPTLSNIYLGSTQLTGTIPCLLANMLYANEDVWPLPVFDYSNSQLSPPDAPIVPAQLQTLHQIYTNGSGSQWPSSEAWDLSSDPCLNSGSPWRGVQCQAILTPTGACETVITELNIGFGGPFAQLPEPLTALTSLAVLDLSFDRIPGTIPASYGNLTSLISLRLIANQLTGTIPDSLAQLVNLQILYLNGNQLSGTVPSFLGDLPNLVQIVGSQNLFTGGIPCSLQARAKQGVTVIFDDNPDMIDLGYEYSPSNCP